jgi:hypothetical protein
MIATSYRQILWSLVAGLLALPWQAGNRPGLHIGFGPI